MAHSFFHKLLLYLDFKDELERIFNEDKRSTSYRGSTRQCCKYIRHDHLKGHEWLFRDYFAESPIYHSYLFRMRFCIGCKLFLHI